MPDVFKKIDFDKFVLDLKDEEDMTKINMEAYNDAYDSILLPEKTDDGYIIRAPYNATLEPKVARILKTGLILNRDKGTVILHQDISEDDELYPTDIYSTTLKQDGPFVYPLCTQVKILLYNNINSPIRIKKGDIIAKVMVIDSDVFEFDRYFN